MKKPGCLTVIGGLLLALIAFAMWMAHDIPKFDAHGLDVEPPVMASESNAFPLLMEATNGWVKPPEWVGLWAKGETNWDEVGAEGLVASNADLFAKVDLALARDGYQSPIVRNLSDPTPWVPVTRNIGRLLLVRSEWHLRRGEKPEAVAAAVKLLRLGYMVRTQSGSMIEYLVGVAVDTMGWNQVLAVSAKLDNPESVRVLQQVVEAYVNPSGGFKSAFCGEYRLAANTVDEFFETGFLPQARRPLWLRCGLMKFLLKPNMTKQEVADYYAELISIRDRPLKDATGPLMLKFNKEWDNPKWTRLMNRNPLGIDCSSLMMRALDNVLGKSAQLEARASGVRQALALRIYYLEKKAWPDKLEQLVPDYLPALPRDPFDGAPSFRYDPAKRLLYAVGADFKDDGGDAEKDMVWKLTE